MNSLTVHFRNEYFLSLRWPAITLATLRRRSTCNVVTLQSVTEFRFRKQSIDTQLLRFIVVVLCCITWLIVTESSVKRGTYGTIYKISPHPANRPRARHLTGYHQAFICQSSVICLCCDYYTLITTAYYLVLSIKTDYHRLLSSHPTPEPRQFNQSLLNIID
jgi:hypothetical protein